MEGTDKHTAGSSSSSTCSGATQPTFLNSDPRTTSGDKSPFLSVTPRLLCQDCQQKKDSQSQQCSCAAGACSPETALWSLKWFHIHHHKIYIVTYSHSHFTQSLNPGDLANGQGCNSFVSCRPGTYVSVSIWSVSGIARTPATLCKPGDAVTSL